MDHISATLPNRNSVLSILPNRQYLIDLPPTIELQERLSCIEDALAAMEADDPRRHRMDAPLKHARRFLRDGITRDEIQADRPDYCWCLGEGGRGRKAIDTAVSSPDLDNPLYDYEKYCSCIDGEHAERRVREYRQSRAINWKRATIDHFFGQAQVPPHFHGHTWETYPVSDQTAASYHLIRRWAAGNVIKGDTRKPGLYLYGQTGSGKTELALCAVRDLLAQEARAVLFIAVPELLERMKQSFNRDAGGSQEPILTVAEGVGILILDDIGKEQPTPWARETLYTLINHRHNWKLPTLFTSEYDRGRLALRLDQATVWRMVEMAESICLDGPNLRDR